MRDPSQPDLETRIKAYYDSRRAPQVVLRLVTQAIQEGESGLTASRRKSARLFTVHWKWALGGAMAAVMAGLIMWGPLLWRTTGPLEAESIAGEIALNHKKQLAPEFQTGRFQELAAAMPKLDFALIQPDRIRTGGHRLLGGRYCSIAGSLAAQMRLRDTAGRELTLYQFVIPTNVSVSDQLIKAGGVVVDIWSEGGVVCGLASDEL